MLVHHVPNILLEGVILLIIKKRYVYLDSPLRMEEKRKLEADKNKDILQEQKKSLSEEEIVQMVANANREAEKIVEEAQQQAQSIILQAQEEYNRIVEEANQRSKELIEQLEKQKEIEIENLRKQIVRIVDTFEKSLSDAFAQYCEKLTAISSVLVEKFLEKQVDPEVTKRKLEKVLAHLAGSTKVKIHINPADAKLLDDETLNFIKEKGYEVVLNENVEYGIIAETDLGTIDATLKFQFALLDEIFEEIFNING